MPVDRAGLRGTDVEGDSPLGGDLIIAIDDLEVQNFEDFMGYLLTYKNPGDDVVISAIRDGKVLEFEVRLAKRP